MTVLERMGTALCQRQRWLLIALLAVVHLALVAGAATTISLLCWVVNVGLFILWQPFIQSERKLGVNSLLLIALALLGGAWVYGWWLLMLWVVAGTPASVGASLTFTTAPVARLVTVSAVLLLSV